MTRALASPPHPPPVKQAPLLCSSNCERFELPEKRNVVPETSVISHCATSSLSSSPTHARAGEALAWEELPILHATWGIKVQLFVSARPSEGLSALGIESAATDHPPPPTSSSPQGPLLSPATRNGFNRVRLPRGGGRRVWRGGVSGSTAQYDSASLLGQTPREATLRTATCKQ